MRVSIEDDGRIQTFEVSKVGIPCNDGNVVEAEVPGSNVEPSFPDVDTKDSNEEPLDPQCFLCGSEILHPEGQYCYGCRVFVCIDHPQTPWGKHKPDAHDSVGPERFGHED